MINFSSSIPYSFLPLSNPFNQSKLFKKSQQKLTLGLTRISIQKYALSKGTKINLRLDCYADKRGAKIAKSNKIK